MQLAAVLLQQGGTFPVLLSLRSLLLLLLAA
jgi:hypothetical protein